MDSQTATAYKAGASGDLGIRATIVITLAIPYPVIDPVLIEFGPFAIRWYALAYIAGIIAGWRYLHWLIKRPGWRITAEDLDDFLLWVTLGIVLGGRLGYVLFYRPAYYLDSPLEALAVWHGGMSFHGGMLGVILAIILFAKVRGRSMFELGDLIAAAAPVGLFFGRLANFINGELYGRVSDVPWAMVFPTGGPEPRHPSQLYEAFLEGVVLFLVLFVFALRRRDQSEAGRIGGIFLVGYGLARSFAELFREPDAHLGFLFGALTMGQLLSFPMILVGLWLIVRSTRGAAGARVSDAG